MDRVHKHSDCDFIDVLRMKQMNMINIVKPECDNVTCQLRRVIEIKSSHSSTMTCFRLPVIINFLVCHHDHYQ
jgi:hypothetical protein